MKWLCLIVLLAACCIVSLHASGGRSEAAENTERNLFASDIYQAIAPEKLSDNVVISPAAIQTTMALAYFGAKGKTAEEIQTGLRLGSSDADDVVNRFREFQKTFTRDYNLRLGTSVYINEYLEFKTKFKNIAQRDFDANVERADFQTFPERTTYQINDDIALKTNDILVDIVKPGMLNENIEGVILNRITFIAPWQKAFQADKTSKKPFSTGGSQSLNVETMWTLNNFKYGEYPTLDAKAIELPYLNSDYAMIVLLPNRNDGLGELIRNIANKNLIELLANEWKMEKVEVYLPKFRATCDVSLEEPLKKLGVSTMFTRSGDFGNLYRMPENHFINVARHQAKVQIAENDGLGELIRNIANKNLIELLANEWKMEKVEVYLPKFRATCDVSLEEPLKKLGVSTMFTRSGDFGNLYRMPENHFINVARHQAKVQIVEVGLEPPMQSETDKNLSASNKKFEANHPFVFAIKHKDSIIFMGHIANDSPK